jgi:hypothetical protein
MVCTVSGHFGLSEAVIKKYLKQIQFFFSRLFFVIGDTCRQARSTINITDEAKYCGLHSQRTLRVKSQSSNYQQCSCELLLLYNG